MFWYEIKAFERSLRPTLELSIECSDDLAAILTGREMVRAGQGLEIWRDGGLVYRVAPSRQRQADIPQPMPIPRRIHWAIFSRFLPRAQPGLLDGGS